MELLPQDLDIPTNVADLTLEDLKPLYAEWLRRVGKSPPQEHDFFRRLELFKRTCVYVTKFNGKLGAGAMGTTLFADWTREEMRTFDHGESNEDQEDDLGISYSFKADPPSRADSSQWWRKEDHAE